MLIDETQPNENVIDFKYDHSHLNLYKISGRYLTSNCKISWDITCTCEMNNSACSSLPSWIPFD